MSQSNDPYRHFGRNVRVARIAAGLTQRQLSERAGCRQAVVSAIENGLRPTPVQLERFAAALGVTTGVLLRPSRARLLVQGARHAAA